MGGNCPEKLDGTDDVIRVYQDGDMVNVAKVGDMATMSTGPEGTYGAPHVVTLTGKGGLILEDVTVFCGPGFGIFEEGGEGGTILKNCKVIPGPTPEGATQPRMLSVSWDAIQHAGTHVGPIVENCIVRDAGDDSWSVQVGTAPALIIKAFPASNRITFKDSEGNDITKLTLAAGDTLRESVDPTSEYRVIDKVSGNIVLLKSGETFPDTWREGMMLYTPNRRCENFVLRNCHFRSSGRVLVKAGKGVIENNRFEDTHSGVTVNSESVLTAIGDLVIRNNDISGTGHFMPASYSNQAGSISVVDGSGTSIAEEGSFRNIVIENNTFSDVSGVNIAVTSANNVIIKDNKFYKTGMTTPNNTGADYGIDQNAVIYVNNVSDIIFDNNPVYSRGLGALVKEDGQVRRRNDKNGGVYDDVSAVEKSVLGKSDNQAYYSGENLVLQVFTPLQGEVPVYIYGISGVLESVCVGKFVSGKASVSVRFGAKGLKVIQIPTSDGIISIKLVI